MLCCGPHLCVPWPFCQLWGNSLFAYGGLPSHKAVLKKKPCCHWLVQAVYELLSNMHLVSSKDIVLFCHCVANFLLTQLAPSLFLPPAHLDALSQPLLCSVTCFVLSFALFCHLLHSAVHWQWTWQHNNKKVSYSTTNNFIAVDKYTLVWSPNYSDLQVRLQLRRCLVPSAEIFGTGVIWGSAAYRTFQAGMSPLSSARSLRAPHRMGAA